MPMIDSEHLKPGLRPVQIAEAAWYKALKAREVAAPEDLPAASEAADKALRAYNDACVELYGYIQSAVQNSEAEAVQKGSPVFRT
ncbi:hypothetical protein PS893_00027 [Pseudomonas fluorescens]|uniref:hypothetical protein n=1 Tax=Pseudomonas fluorescens TaxID=294 RepID=UPI001259106F|nr:hypothetical protein [Pseudomonas fluorescens]VVO46046.1 hypothetical protein PS893_00027 [Pseudomonas fluorescens]